MCQKANALMDKEIQIYMNNQLISLNCYDTLTNRSSTGFSDSFEALAAPLPFAFFIVQVPV